MADIWDNLRNGAITKLDEYIWNTRQLSGGPGHHESPIEEALAVAFDVYVMLSGGRVVRQLPSDTHRDNAEVSEMIGTYMVAQHSFGAYRADLLIGLIGAGTMKQTSIVVECDGHQWHERTPQQAQRDRERERFLNLHVAKVIRFTGSEIFRDPLACASQIQAALDQTLFAMHGL